MKERPIIFGGEMVRAILSGAKTQTRRVVKPQPEWEEDPSPGVNGDMALWGGRYREPQWPGNPDEPPDFSVEVWESRCPYGVPGDHLWVKENFYIESFGAGVAQIRYEADFARGNNAGVSDSKLPDRCGKVSSMRMPRHCSRLTLEIVGVRVERVQEISEEDADAEGIDDAYLVKERLPSDARVYAFRHLWDDINAKRGFGWDVNPWVFVISFRRA